MIEHTGSVVTQEILHEWLGASGKFVKVFLFEYQRALRAFEEDKLETEIKVELKAVENGISEKNEHKVNDIEEAIQDLAIEKRRTKRVLDKTRGFIKYKCEITM